MMSEPKTDPIPAPDPATPTVAAPAPINLAAESMSDLIGVVDTARDMTGTVAPDVCARWTADITDGKGRPELRAIRLRAEERREREEPFTSLS